MDRKAHDMTEARKPIICLDFDGVIHDYKLGWQNGTIYGDVTPGFWEWAEAAQEHFKLVIYSSRSRTETGLSQMQRWLLDQWAEHNRALHPDERRTVSVMAAWFDFAHEKPPAFLTIDDRCIRFDGDWLGMDPHQLLKYKTWTQRA
jgi:hypothetical protein